MYIFLCGFAHMELLRLVDLQSQTVSEHNASCECYSSHIETEILAMKLSN